MIRLFIFFAIFAVLAVIGIIAAVTFNAMSSPEKEPKIQKPKKKDLLSKKFFKEIAPSKVIPRDLAIANNVYNESLLIVASDIELAKDNTHKSKDQKKEKREINVSHEHMDFFNVCYDYHYKNALKDSSSNRSFDMYRDEQIKMLENLNYGYSEIDKNR